MNTVKARLQKLQLIVAAVVMVGANLALVPMIAHAATMTNASVIETNMNATGTSSFTIVFKAGAADIAGTLSVNFGAWGGTVNAVQSVSTAGCIALTGAGNILPGVLTAAGAGNTVTLSSVGALTAGQSYCATLTSATAVTNPGAGVYSVVLNDAGDTTTVAIDVIANDQVVVSATVPPTFTMALSSNTDNLGTLSAASVASSTGVNATISTNGNYGWFLWALDSQAGLNSTSQSKLIPTVPTGSNANMTTNIGTEKYALGVTTGNATANYTDSGFTGSGLSTTVYNKIASGNAAVAGAVATVKELATISATTPAATDYSDTVTLVGAGSF